MNKFDLDDIVNTFLDKEQSRHVPGGGQTTIWMDNISDYIIEDIENEIAFDGNVDDVNYLIAKRKFVERNAYDIDEIGIAAQRERMNK